MNATVLLGRGREVDGPYLVMLRGWTEENYFRFASEDRICEFKDGTIIMHSPATPRHQGPTGLLFFLLSGFCDVRKAGRVDCGPCTVRLRPDLDREPDVFVVRPEHAHRFTERCLEGAPDLAIEVTMESTESLDLRTKRQEYEEYGVEEYWVVHVRRCCLVRHRRVGERFRKKTFESGRLESTAIPGFWIRVEWLWQDPSPSKMECLREILGGFPT